MLKRQDINRIIIPFNEATRENTNVALIRWSVIGNFTEQYIIYPLKRF